jgi:hypothetical protein
MNRSYASPIHDPILTELNQKWRRTDLEIADEMGFDRETISANRVRLKLPMNARPRPAGYPAQKSTPAPKSKPNPLDVAKLWLGKRLVEKPAGYFLDSVPVNLTCIMKAANRVIKAEGGEQVSYSEEWLV